MEYVLVLYIYAGALASADTWRQYVFEEVMNEHVLYYYALIHARKNNCHGPVYRIVDCWGGYWQTLSDHGVYNFTVKGQ